MPKLRVLEKLSLKWSLNNGKLSWIWSNVKTEKRVISSIRVGVVFFFFKSEIKLHLKLYLAAIHTKQNHSSGITSRGVSRGHSSSVREQFSAVRLLPQSTCIYVFSISSNGNSPSLSMTRWSSLKSATHTWVQFDSLWKIKDCFSDLFFRSIFIGHPEMLVTEHSTLVSCTSCRGRETVNVYYLILFE